LSEVKWIKLVTEFFDDEKIKLIEAMPEADMVLVIWIKLLTLAGKKNMNGYIFLTKNIPYTDEMLATIFNRPVNTIRLALDIFKKFKMINYDNNGILQMSNWEKHQNIEGLDKIKKANRIRQQRYKEQHLLEMNQDLSICPYCGESAKLTIDHIIPLSKGGKDEVNNKILCCLKCNQSKTNRDLDIFLNARIKMNEPVNINAITHNKKLMNFLEYKDNKFRRVIITPINTTDKIRVDKNRIEQIRLDKKKKYNDAVFLTQNEYNKLITELGESSTAEYIERLSLYIRSQGKEKKYKSHYATILAWNRKDLKGGKNNGTGKGYNNRYNKGPEKEGIDKYKHLEEIIQN